jgi:hypothetical protein
MKTNFKITGLVLLFLCGLITSCKKVVDLQLNDASSQLIIEGNVTDVAGPQTVMLSKSVPFGATNTFPPVTGATVKISDTFGRIYAFTERTPGTYVFNSLTGRYNETYTLQVQIGDKIYKAKSTMPDGKVKIDSITMATQIFGDNTTTKTIAVYYQDPPYRKNYYRFILNVNGVMVKVVYARSDQFSDGRHVQVTLYQDDITIKNGDKIDVEMQCVDPTIYNYWFTFSQQQNDFSSTTPSNPPNNFDSDVLGYFSAHTTAHTTFTVK